MSTAAPSMESLEKLLIPVRGTDVLDTASRCAGLVAQQLRIDLHDLAKGLRWMHKNFETVSASIRPLYSTKDEKLASALTILLTDMCSDRVLRDKFVRAGAAEFLISLLSHPTNSYLALRALSVVSSHAGPLEGAIIAKVTAAPLVAFGKELPPDDSRFPLLIAVVMHCSYISSSTSGASPDDMLDLLAAAAAHPDAHTHNHGFQGYVSAVHNNRSRFLKTPRRQRVLVGNHFRHPDPRMRMTSLQALYGVSYQVAEVESVKMDSRLHDEAAGKLSSDPALNAELKKWGAKGEYYSAVEAQMLYGKTISEAWRTSDFLKHGKNLIKVIYRSELGVAEGLMQLERPGKVHPLSGKQDFQWASASHGSFGLYLDSLPLAAAALRAEEGEDSLDAHILSIKFKMARQQHTEARNEAQKALIKHPDCAYLYYSLSIGSIVTRDFQGGLQAAKQGLKATPEDDDSYIRRNLHQLAAEHAIDIAGACLAGDSQPYVGERWELSDDVALAYTRSAFESIQAYIRIAPPDARMMSSMLLRYLNLAPVVLGPDINLISPEMIPFVEKLRVADAIGTIISGPRAKTQPRIAHEIATKNYNSAMEEWEPIFAKFDEMAPRKPLTFKKDEKGVERIAESMKCGSGSQKRPASHYLVSHITDLYLCSWCSSASAKLKRCSRCSGARYCGAACQKAAWKLHKTDCNRMVASLKIS